MAQHGADDFARLGLRGIPAMSTFIDASVVLAKAHWAIRAYAFALDVRKWDDLDRQTRRQLIELAQESLLASVPPHLADHAVHEQGAS